MTLKRIRNLKIIFCLAAVLLSGIEGKSFPCQDGDVVLLSDYCDGKPDCHDRSDELHGCTRGWCGKGNFTCFDGACLPISIRCDGKPDCGDGADELYCDKAMFRCDNDHLIRSFSFCDGEDDCGDNSDESSVNGCNMTRCGKGKFICGDQCFRASSLCDSKQDCSDGWDELHCDESKFQCANGSFIRNYWFCDGDYDCVDKSDESFGCTKSCGKEKFACNTGECLPISVHCDAKRDCSDGSDEHDCDNTLFRCKTDVLVHNYLFCDGKNDCKDNSDESYGCSKKCKRGHFTCKSGECLPISVRCDNKQDCDDGSDELNCVDKLSLENCTTQQGKYLCKDRTRCISFANTCDGIESCPDASDESENCTARTDSCDLTCPHPCWRTPEGPQCFCQYLDTPHETACDEVEDCEQSQDVCQQICSKFHGNITQCSCSEGYNLLLPTRKSDSCFNEAWYENVLLYSNNESIVGYNMTTLEKIFVQKEGNVTSISAAHNFVYWSPSSNGLSKMFRMNMLSKKKEEIIYSDFNDTSINSIAIDWISNNLFVTSQRWLFVCNNNATICSHLKYSVFGIECVVLLPRKGLMFWVQNTEYKYSKARILKSSMDGSDERLLVDENLRFSDHLVVDESSERIYWIDRELMIIESIKYNGKQRKIVVPKARNVVSFTVFEGILYRTKKFNNNIFRNENLDVWLPGDSNIKKIHIFNPLVQKTKILNPCLSCSGLCLLRPASPAPGLNCTCIYKHPNTITNRNPTRFPNTRNSSSRNAASNGTSSLENLNGHFETTPRKGLPTGISAEQSSGKSGTGGEVMLRVTTLILLLCVITALGFYYIKYESKRRKRHLDEDIVDINLKYSNINNE